MINKGCDYHRYVFVVQTGLTPHLMMGNIHPAPTCSALSN
jgi:hypothetical protein